MGRNVDDMLGALPAGRRRRIERRAQELIGEEMTLQQLRQAHKKTQAELANTLGVAQKQISKIEERTDMHISTLRRQVEAMGGSLDLVARFPRRPAVLLTGLSPETSRTSVGRPAAAARRAPARKATSAGR